MITAIILTVFIADTVYVLVVRLMKAKLSHNIFSALEYITTPHKSHFYQILAKNILAITNRLYLLCYIMYFGVYLYYVLLQYIEHVFFVILLSTIFYSML